MQIDKSKPVMVTGANGYVASWLVKKLLDEGITVHAAVRNPENKKKYQHLDNLAANAPGKIKYFKADLLEEGSYAEAMEGCELVYHTASPYILNVKNPQKELIDPALKGTQNVLNQANKTPSVKRVVLTSSCAAIYTDAIDCKSAPNGTLTEEVWNTSSSLDYQPYYYSKTLAEKEAWKMADDQNQWDLVVINPSGVFGPALSMNTDSESISILKQFADGTLKKGAPKVGIGLVDVRDLAEAHYLAGYTPAANGRNIISGHNTNFLEMGLALQERYRSSYPIPKSALPKWLLMIIGPIVNKALSRRFIKNNVNIEWKADNSKSKKELGVSYRPLKQTMEDSFQFLIESGLTSKK
ncbi:NAD-dependent epimerase/dehydratase family protein [Owenweeksia hongkongensis]|uniref:NAD-dependent epimerase/dehydratase family protein n=1 Tax=Owenweeksia hongkongensis TaxID=253245 RepID=UPI003A906153